MFSRCYRFNTQDRVKFRNIFTILLLFTTCVTYIFSLIDTSLPKYPSAPYTRNAKQYKTVLSSRSKRHLRLVILLWTPFFGGMGWYTDSKEIFGSGESSRCTLSNNKSEIANADAVVFHLSDIAWYGSVITGLGVPFPKYRSPQQTWILYTLEPLPQIWFDSSSWNGKFNWTMSFRTDSDVSTPYGEFKAMSADEIDNGRPNPRNNSLNQAVVKRSWSPGDEMDDKSTYTHNYHKDHEKEGGIAIMSNCVDDARRYRIVESLKKHISVKVIGKCGDDFSADFQSRMKIVPQYKFNLALENSDCKDYVSEKYWRSLELHQIPIVAWKNNMSGIVIPGSYINVYDFRNFDEAGKHIAEVGGNETLYNSYFDWMNHYKVAYRSGWHKLCDALHSNYSHMFYHDIDGWLKDDTCKPVTIHTCCSHLDSNQKCIRHDCPRKRLIFL